MLPQQAAPLDDPVADEVSSDLTDFEVSTSSPQRVHNKNVSLMLTTIHRTLVSAMYINLCNVVQILFYWSLSLLCVPTLFA